MDKMIEVVNVTKNYGEGAKAVQALRGVNLFAKKGEIVSIMGPSGSGKSTLLHLMGGLDVPTGGAVIIDGQDTQKLNDRNLTLLRRRKLGFVFQFFNLLPTMSVEENIALPLVLEKVDKATVAQRVNELIAIVGLEHRRTHKPDELSGGQQQRVAIARALANNPALLLADEPTGNLDSKTGAEILALMRETVQKFNQTIVMVTHDPKVAEHGDRIVVIKDGLVDEERAAMGAGAGLVHA